ncbi:MAG: DUF2306 domain-containing protein [Pseudomonadota bacterium]
MEMPIGVLAIYGAIAVWFGLLARSYKTGSYKSFLWFGVFLLLYLNIRYLIEGAPAGIAFFIGIYDVLINLGLSADESAAALSRCENNACTVWGDRYVNHPAWGAAFYERFVTGSDFRSNLLYGHLTFNSIAFVLMHVQMLKPGFGENAGLHRLIGRISFLSLTIGVGCAVWLASEHGSVTEYGGSLSSYGFYSMSAFVYGTAIMGVLAIRSGDVENHRIWMFRFAGSMWGSFWLFRAMLLVLDPLLRNYETAAILICIWFSAPLGILIAEMVRRSIDRKQYAKSGAQVQAAE